MEFLRAQRERRNTLNINDPQLVESVEDIWGSAAQMATVGIFVILLVTALYFARPVLLPVVAAMVSRIWRTTARSSSGGY